MADWIGDRGHRLTGALAAVLTAGLLLGAGDAAAQSACSKVAAPGGSDSADGTEASPYRTVERLAESLGAGETGCLRAGVYGGRDVDLTAARATLTSYPGELATITAFVEVEPSARGARLLRLRFDTTGHSNSVGTKIQADDAVFADNVVTKGGEGICLLVGSWSRAARVVIERNHIYDCGPSSSKFDHQIYLEDTQDAVVRWNILNGNAGGWGVHLYSNADGSLVEHNIIHGNRGGVIFAGDGNSQVSENNTVRFNAITSSGPRWNIEGSWSGGPRGGGNVAHHNCVQSVSAGEPSGIADEDGFSAHSNATVSGSPYRNAGGGDWSFVPGSPCEELVGAVASAVGTGSSPGTPAVQPTSPRGGDSLRERVRRGQLRKRARRATHHAVLLKAASRRLRIRRGVLLKGRVPGEAVRGERVKLQVRGRKRWRTVGERRIRARGRFAARLRTRAVRRHRHVRMRAVLPGVGRSRVVHARSR